MNKPTYNNMRKNESSKHISFSDSDSFSLDMELCFQASKLPLSLFENGNLARKASYPIQDFNLPLILYNSLPASLPPVWYSFTPEYVYLGGITIADGILLLVGPTMTYECTNKQALALCRRLCRKLSDVETFRTYFSQICPHTVPELKAALRLLCRIFELKDPKEIPLIPFAWNLPYPILHLPEYSDVETELEENSGENLEPDLLSCISTGNLQALNQLINERLPSVSGTSELPLTKIRSFIIGANMIASRTAVQSGVDPRSFAESVSQYNELLLKATTLSELSMLFFRFLQEYTARVAELHELPTDSPIVRFVHQYITSHYNEPVTPHILAQKKNISCPYLCSHFKKETGMTVSFYVQKEKIREAERLLIAGNYSIAEISASLAFSSESYFCAVFKKITGTTPKKFRDTHRI